MQLVRTQCVSVRTPQCPAHVRQRTLTPTEEMGACGLLKPGHLLSMRPIFISSSVTAVHQILSTAVAIAINNLRSWLICASPILTKVLLREQRVGYMQITLYGSVHGKISIGLNWISGSGFQDLDQASV